MIKSCFFMNSKTRKKKPEDFSSVLKFKGFWTLRSFDIDSWIFGWIVSFSLFSPTSKLSFKYGL